MSFLGIIATILGSIAGLSIFFQAYKIFKRKSAKDVSILMYLFILVNGIAWILYGLEIKNAPLIIANLVGGVNVILVIIGWWMYGRGIN